MQNALNVTPDGLIDRVSRSGFTMADVCREAGVAQSTPSRWKANNWEPKPRTLRSLDAALNKLIERRDESPQGGA